MNCNELEQKGAFDKYLRGELSEEESARLESHCFSCDDCFRRLEATEAIIKVIRDTPREKLLGRRQRKPFPILRLAAALACAAGIAFVAILLVPLLRTGSNRFASLVEWEAPRYITGQIRGGGEPTVDPSFSAAMSLYQRGEYKQAAARLEEALRRFPQNPQATFYLGISLLLTRKPQQALACFEELIRRQAESYLDDSRWYAAMACLQLGDGSKAERHLQILAAKESRHFRRASELIARIHERQE